MNFFIMRHSRTKMNGKGILLGSSDIDIEDKADPEVQKWVSLLKKNNCSRIFHSGMKRAEQTVDIIKPHLPIIPIITDERLRELNFGDWELKSYDWLFQSQNKLYVNWLNDPFQIAPPNGETANQLKERLFSFFSEWGNKNSEESALVISHGGPIRILWSIFNRTSFYEKDVSPSSLFYLNWKEQKMDEIKFDISTNRDDF